MAKPMQFTMVRAVPLISAGAFWATKVEKSGESAMTTMPQNKRKPIKKGFDAQSKNTGDNRQHKPDKNRAVAAVILTPFSCEI